MSAGGTTRPDTTTGGNGGYSAPPAPPGFLPAPPPGPPAYPRPAVYGPRPRRFRGVLAGLGIVVAIALAAAALVVSLTNTHETPAAQPAPPSTNQPVSTTAADRALCEAIAPLIRESTAEGNAYAGIGNPGTPARDAATPGFVKQTLDWVARAQPVLDQHATPPRYLIRSLQRFIDDMHMYAS